MQTAPQKVASHDRSERPVLDTGKPQEVDQGERPAVDVAKPHHDVPLDAALRRMAAIAKTSPLRITREYISLAFGPGRLSFSDYMSLRLFDNEYYAGVDKRAVVGQRRSGELGYFINYRQDWWGLVGDKIAAASYLSAHGFPIIPALAMYVANLRSGSRRVLRNEAQLRTFLMDESNYPMFGKPTDECQSLGSIGLKRYASGDRVLETVDGRSVALDTFVGDVVKHYSKGYVFQKFLSPHPTIRTVCGDRLATVRFVTISTADGPKVFRACWKIPAGTNIADNYWRPGNLLAQLDPAQGRVMRAVSGAGLQLVEVTHHPDTNVELDSVTVPHWEGMVRTAVEAARLMQHVPMIGWDMACLEGGPTIVEMNVKPDFFLNQLADRRGVLDSEFTEFMALQKRNAADHVKSVRAVNKNL
jgi:hypothetical protein